jgi:hypothetical protein
MSAIDVDALAERKAYDLLDRSEVFGWAACAAIWARTFVLASDGWKRWPEFAPSMQKAFSFAILRCTESSSISPPELLMVKLESFDIEDDGSAEWQFAIDFIAMILTALDGQDVRACLEIAIHSYLDGKLNVLRNEYAVSAGGVISNDAAMKRLANDPEWLMAIEFIEVL